MILRSALAATLCLFLLGCATAEKKAEPPKEQQPQPRRIGTVVLVNEDLQFVLVDVGSYQPATGQALKCFTGESESAVLSVSPEAKRPFIAADILQGHPQKGDEVFE